MIRLGCRDQAQAKLTEMFSFRNTPALHPRLRTAAGVSALDWTGGYPITDVLEPGLAAEASALLQALPTVIHMEATGLFWRCEMEVPLIADAQHPETAYRLARFLDRDLPSLASQLLGRTMVRVRPGILGVCILRKGSWISAVPPAGQVIFRVDLTGSVWPAEWGGHTSYAGSSYAPAFDVLHLIPDAVELPLVLRHVESVALQGLLVPA